ncbi:MAG TPA: hypothetical protein PKE31_02215 [Pseudomonadota bacterium]|nr:hypothetical protein [Pseudomonadota bacterium]
MPSPKKPPLAKPARSASAPPKQKSLGLPQTGHGRVPWADRLAELEEVAHKASCRVTYDNMTGELGSGGLCKVKGEWRVIIDKRAPTPDRVTILASALVRLPLDGIPLSPDLDQLLSSLRTKPHPAQDPESPQHAD